MPPLSHPGSSLPPSRSRKAPSLAAALVLCAVLGCRSAPEVRTGSGEVSRAELQVEQGLMDCELILRGEVESPEPATLERAHLEVVVDGTVQKTEDLPLSVQVTPSAPARFQVRTRARYPESSEAGRTALTALRGQLIFRSGEKSWAVEIARSKEVRLPRPPKVVLREAHGARYSEEEVELIFSLGVENPNPFPVRLSGLKYAAQVAGKELSLGKLGAGDLVAPASTSLFELQVPFTQQSFGPEVKQQVGRGALLYRLSGHLVGERFDLPYDLSGELRLNASPR